MRWFITNQVNIGLLCGGIGKLCVLDFDSRIQYINWRDDTMLLSSALWGQIAENGYKVITGRGVHVYIKTKFAQPSYRCDKYKADVKGEGGIAIAPPSVHPSGAMYTPLNDGDIYVVACQQELLDAVPPVSSMSHRGRHAGIWDDIESMAACYNGPYVDVRSALPIVDFVQDIGGERPIKYGRDKRFGLTRCIYPGHKDSHASMRIDTVRNTLNCSSTSCPLHSDSYWLNVVDVYKLICDMDEYDAYMELRQYVLFNKSKGRLG